MLAIDIAALARQNEDFRREVATAEHSQVVPIMIPPGEEVHQGIDQLLVFVEGEAEAVLAGDSSGVSAGEAVAPPEHSTGTAHRTKVEADAAEHH
jgi:mannose-6-phosphate isomerase-like protein (cupin superfamily)